MKLKSYEEKVETIYSFFNNYAMYRDAQRLLTLHRTGKPPPSPFGPKSVAWALRTFEDWPATKSKLPGKCGGWYYWIAPNKSMKLKGILQQFRKREYADANETEEEAERVWDETGYPSAKQVEESNRC
jgi:hypothetical protein